jgi:excisionase family DNA binding protein
MQEYMKIGQVAEMLGVHVNSVRRWIARKQLPAQRIHGQYRVRRVDVLAKLEHVHPQTVPMSQATEEALRRHGLL